MQNNTTTDSMSTEFHSEMMRKLYNFMKISEMSRYSIRIFQNALNHYLQHMSEEDICTLVSSYWCNAEHFNAMISLRGSEIYHDSRLRLDITDKLLDSVVAGGATTEKLKQILLQRRNDIFSSVDTVIQSIDSVIEEETRFFKRNCRLRFWNHEVLIRSFSDNGWLSQTLAQYGLDQFLHHVLDRRLEQQMQYNEQFCKESSEESTHIHGLDASDAVSLICFNDEEDHPSTEDLRALDATRLWNDPNGGLISRKTLCKWISLLELVASRGAVVSQRRLGVSSLMNAIKRGNNTYNFLQKNGQERNDLISHLGLCLPDDLWCIISHLL